MKNARRILSLVLSFLMVFGSVATLLPTTVMAAEQETSTTAEGELSVTFLDESENTIAVIPFNGTTTIKGLLEGNSADVAKVKKATAQTDTKVFIGWTLEDGTAFNTTEEITESLTVKANVSKYVLYNHTDIAGFYDSGNITLGKLSHDTTVTNAFRMRAIKNNTGSHALNWAIAFDNPSQAGNNPVIDSTKLIDNAAESREYEVFVAKFKTNQSALTTSNTSWIQIYNEFGVNVGTDGYSGPTNNDKKRIQYSVKPTGATEDGTGIDDVKAVYHLSKVVTDTKISGFRFAPWSGASIVSDSASGPATTDDPTVAYADIEYFALFEKEEAVELFDYSKYGNFNVIFTDEKDNVITTISAKGTDTLGALINANPDAKALIDAATAQTATRVFAGWTLTDGTAVDLAEGITESKTVKASFSAYMLYTPADLMAEYESGRIETSHFNLSTTSYDSRSFLHLQSRLPGSHQFQWTFEPAMTDYTTIVIPHITNTTWTALSQSSFVQVLPSADQTDWTGITAHYHAKSSTNIIESDDGTSVSGTDDIFAIYDISDEESAGRLKFAPWRGRNVTGTSNLCRGPAKISGVYSDAYVDIEYIAFFEKDEAVEYFNYNTYLAQKDIAYFKNAEGAIVDELTQVATGGIITLPDYDDVNFLGWQIEGASDNTVYEAGDEIAISRPTVFVPFISTSISLTVTDNEGEKTVEVSVGMNIPLNQIVLQYVDAETGELMVISGFEVGDTEYPIDDGYIVNEEETSIEVLYAPAYILSAADGTLETGTSRNAATVNAPVDSEEVVEGNTVYFKHITGVKDATTRDVSQARFLLTEEGDNINNNAGKITYGETPYVSYLYRTNIDLTSSAQTLKAAYTVNNFSANDGYTGTAKFGQVIENVEPHNDWQILVHKPETFGKMTADAEFPGYLDGIYISPWSNEAGIVLTGEEYADIRYIGFFPNETAAKSFDYDSYLDFFKVGVTVEIDGVVNEALSGKEYMPGASIELPEVDGVAGYLYDGMVVMSAKVPEDDNGDGSVTISVTSRRVNTAKYIQSRGDLNNLKKAGKDGTITVVYIGGSATSGTGASNKAFSWASLTTKYLKTKYANVIEYNEGLGGHGSRSAAFRLQKDVIDHNPDLVIIETSMNDHYDGDMVDGVYGGKYYEYVIRTIREKLPNTEIVTAYTINNGLVKKSDGTMRDGKHPVAAAQDVIADYYDVSSIDIGRYAFEAIFGENGTYSAEEWAKYYQDSVHPLDSGYALYARAISEYLEAALEGECPETVPDEEVPAEALCPEVIAFRPSVITLDDQAVEFTGMELLEQERSSTFKYYLKTTDNPGSGTIKFSFVGTEFGMYMSMPGDNFDAETDGSLDQNATGTVTVQIDGTEYTEVPSRKAPFMYGENLENTKHDVIVTLSNVDNTECRVYGIMVGGEFKAYTITFLDKDGNELPESGEYNAGTTVTLPEAPEYEGLIFEGWKADGELITKDFTATKSVTLTASYVSESDNAPVRLVAFIGRGNMGYFTVGDSSAEENYLSEYVDSNKATTLTAVAYDGYVPAYWVRFTQDSLTEVLVATGDVANVYPLGGSVYYQPVFKTEGETVALYIDAATREIIAVDEAPADYNTIVENQALTTAVVTVYDCSNTETPDENNIFTAYDIDGEVIEEAQNPAFGDNIIIKKTETNATPLWTVKLGDKEFTASYKDNFSFNYMFNAGTEVEVYEKALDGEATPAISTIATWTEGNITRFTGLFALPEGCTLVNHGVMMSQNKEHLAALENNATGELNVTATTIVGRVSDNTENATPLFTIAKRLSDLDEVWYGRAFLVYTAGETTYVVYADNIVPASESADITEGDLPGNEEIYNPMYWDDSINFGE